MTDLEETMSDNDLVDPPEERAADANDPTDEQENPDNYAGELQPEMDAAFDLDPDRFEYEDDGFGEGDTDCEELDGTEDDEEPVEYDFVEEN